MKIDAVDYYSALADSHFQAAEEMGGQSEARHHAWLATLCLLRAGEAARAMREVGMSARYLGSNRLGGGNPRDCQSQTWRLLLGRLQPDRFWIDRLFAERPTVERLPKGRIYESAAQFKPPASGAGLGDRNPSFIPPPERGGPRNRDAINCRRDQARKSVLWPRAAQH